MPTDTLSDDDLTRLYTWVDEIKLSRPKRNIARDFSDGVLVAEVRREDTPWVPAVTAQIINFNFPPYSL